MKTLLKSLSGLSSRTLLLPLAFSGMLLTAACGSNPLSLLTGGGPNVAANTQVGKTNTQSVGVTNVNAPKVSLRPKARVEKIDQSNTTNQELPPWVWIVFSLLFIIGWVTDTPGTYIQRLRGKNA